MTDFFLRRVTRFFNGYYDIKSYLGNNTHRKGYYITPTSGDMHCGGKLPYFMNYNGGKYVYKPRDMRIDFELNEAFKVFNQFFDEDIKLPVVNINFFKNNTGYMDFVSHKDNMTMEEAINYFRKFGALMAASKLLGITDLHCENIMATEKGPVIIDSECALVPDLIEIKEFSRMTLGRVRAAFLNKRNENSVFSVNGEILPLSTEKFQTAILEGFKSATSSFINNQNTLINLFNNIINKDLYIRIVSIATAEFYDNMFLLDTTIYDIYRNNYYFGVYISIDTIKDKVLEGLYNCIKKDFKGEIDFDKDNVIIILNELYNSLAYGEIPIFRIENYKTLYINNIAICDISLRDNYFKTLKDIFLQQIQWLNSDEAIEKLSETLF